MKSQLREMDDKYQEAVREIKNIRKGDSAAKIPAIMPKMHQTLLRAKGLLETIFEKINESDKLEG